MTKYFRISLLVLFTAGCAFAVTSKVIRQTTAEDFASGKYKDVIISSRGFLQLGRSAATVAKDFNDVWVINTMVRSIDGSIFIGTSPNGDIFRYHKGKLNKIWSGTQAMQTHSSTNDANDANDPNAPGESPQIINRHVFAMASHRDGSVIAAVSGGKCCLLRIAGTKAEVIYEPNDIAYIFAVAVHDSGDIYIGTGAEGKILRLAGDGSRAEVIYDSPDKNILSLCFDADGFLYAGSDTRGVVYKINTAAGSASVLYDSPQEEITSLLFDNKGNLYATATSYKVAMAQDKSSRATKNAAPGRPETPKIEGDGDEEGVSLKTPGGKDEAAEQKVQKAPKRMARGEQGNTSVLYKIDAKGYVTNVFDTAAVFFCLEMQDNNLLLGTGNKAELFSIDPANETDAVIYQDQQASQISSLLVAGGKLYAGTANPAGLIEISGAFAGSGEYVSDLIDAGQPARWGKLQLDADIPAGCKVSLSARSGNVEDINDKTFSPWTAAVDIAGPTDLTVPLGRFCQYKLVLTSANGKKTPVIREITTAYVMPNLAPVVEDITIERPEKDQPSKAVIKFNAADENEDPLEYRLEFRRTGRDNWICLEKKLEKNTCEWDTATVEDGIYEVRIIASDLPGNNELDALKGTRISEPFIIDNTPVKIKNLAVAASDDAAVVRFTAVDELSIVQSVQFTVDSNEQWKAVIPNDSVNDTKTEDFTVVASDLEKGMHVVAVKIIDSMGNVIYKTLEVEIK